MKNSMLYIFAFIVMTLSVDSCKKEDSSVNKVFGCTDVTATNYNPSANTDNGTCTYAGDATFWYNSNGTTATVTVGGYTRYITAYYSTYNPSCGSSGCANFTLPTGTYSYYASSTFSTWSGNITVSKNGCTRILLL